MLPRIKQIEPALHISQSYTACLVAVVGMFFILYEKAQMFLIHLDQHADRRLLRICYPMLKRILDKRDKYQRYNLLVGYVSFYFIVDKRFLAKPYFLEIDIILHIL